MAATVTHGLFSNPPNFHTRRRHHKNFSSYNTYHIFRCENKCVLVLPGLNSSTFRFRCFKEVGRENQENPTSEGVKDGTGRVGDEVFMNEEKSKTKNGISFLIKIALALGIAMTATAISIRYKQPGLGPSFGLQILSEGSSSSMNSEPVGFTFRTFGHRIVLPEYAPGWIYFWLLMAAGCGLFISEEALNIWVGITLSRMLSLDGTWQTFAQSFSKNRAYIISTVVWVYWGVCISDLIPFYMGKLFRQTGASDDVCSRLGIGKEKALEITNMVQKYGNLIGFVERFSLGVRNPTAFLAGTMGISPECYFAGVCCGGLLTLPIQLGIGFLLRERPVFALATVATVVGIWTVFPYAVAAATALFLYLQRQYFSSS